MRISRTSTMARNPTTVASRPRNHAISTAAHAGSADPNQAVTTGGTKIRKATTALSHRFCWKNSITLVMVNVAVPEDVAAPRPLSSFFGIPTILGLPGRCVLGYAVRVYGVLTVAVDIGDEMLPCPPRCWPEQEAGGPTPFGGGAFAAIIVCSELQTAGQRQRARRVARKGVRRGLTGIGTTTYMSIELADKVIA